jgi:cytosine/creatinine deaminase
VVDVSCVAEAVAMRPKRKLVIKGGRIVAKDGVLVP